MVKSLNLCKKSEAAASGATGIPEPTWGPKKVLKTTNYLDVDPQDYAKITAAREAAANATQAKILEIYYKIENQTV